MGTGDVERMLDAATAALRVTMAERAAIRRYQSMGRTFEQLNELYRGRAAPSALARRLMALAQTLDDLLTRADLPADLVVYRGLRDLSAVVPQLDALPQTAIQTAVTSASLDRVVALRDFADRERGGMLRIRVGAGTPAVWIAPLGDPALRYEAEVLLARETFLDYQHWRLVDGVVEVDCEVVG